MTSLSSSTIVLTFFGTLLLLFCVAFSGSSVVAQAVPIGTVGLSSGWATFGEAVPQGAASGRAQPFLRVHFDTRVYHDGQARLDTSVEDLLDQVGATTVTYDIGARSYENVVFPRSGWRHCPHTQRPEPFEARA